jgi:hypothetical protein
MGNEPRRLVHGGGPGAWQSFRELIGTTRAKFPPPPDLSGKTLTVG